MFKRALFAISILFFSANLAWAVPTCTISGPVYDGAGNPVVNGTITFNTLFTQIVSGNTINQTLVSTTTDEDGSLVPISLAQGVYVQVTINGGAPVTAIVPFTTAVTFAQLLSNIIANPSITVLQIPGSTPAPVCTAGDGSLYFDSVTNQLMLDENCGGYLQVLSAVNNFPDCQDVGGNHLNYIASSKTLTCGTTGGGGGGGSNPQSDAVAILMNQADNTKLLRLDLSGLTTATTRVLTVPNRTATLGTTTGTLTSGNLTKFDASGNVIDSGQAAPYRGAFSGHSTNVIPASTTAYFPAFGVENYSATEVDVSTVVPFAGTVRNMYCIQGPLGAGGTASYIFRKNSASSTVACSISASAGTCSDLTHTVSVVAGDVVDFQVVTNASVATPGRGRCAVEVDPS